MHWILELAALLFWRCIYAIMRVVWQLAHMCVFSERAVVLIFTGAGGGVGDMRAVEDAIEDAFGKYKMLVFDPRKCINAHYWAEYVPLSSEIAFLQRKYPDASYQDRKHWASAHTYNCDLKRIPEAMSRCLWGALRVSVGCRVYAAAWSNGAVMAGELALHGMIHGVALCSGVPALSQQMQVQMKNIVPHAILTVSRHERSWTGPVGVVEGNACFDGIKVIYHRNRHGDDPPSTLRQVFKYLAHRDASHVS